MGAQTDLEAIEAHPSDEYGAGVARRVLNDLSKGVKSLATFPFRGTELGDYRRIIEGQYAIFYLVSEQIVDVVRILHVSRERGRHLN